MSVTFTIGADTYRMDVFPLPATAETNPAPLDLVVIGGKVWLGCEFDRRIYSLPTSAADGTAMTAHTIPAPSTEIFRTNVFGGGPSFMSQVEDIDGDPAGNVWISQRGASPTTADGLNLSRVLRYTPSTDTWKAWPLPYNNAGCGAVLLDGARLWASCGETGVGGAICATRHLSWMPEDCDPTVAPLVRQGEERGGWRQVQHSKSWPAHMAIGPDGRLYVTNYFDAGVSAYDRETMAVQHYPLPAGSTKPWQIAFDLGGACWVTCDETRQLAKLVPATGAWTVYETGLATTEKLHSHVLDSGAWWFTAYSNTTTGGRIGRRTSGGAMELSPQLDTLGFEKGAAGITISGGQVWVALFGSKAIGRLTKL